MHLIFEEKYIPNTSMHKFILISSLQLRKFIYIYI